MSKKKGENHSEGTLIIEFCTQRTDTCKPCGNKYASIVTASDYLFPRLVQKKSGPVTLDISQNAHHILCVAEVTGIMSSDDKLKKVLQNTKWCINHKRNMISLPLFYHTVYWYCLDKESRGAGRMRIGRYFTTRRTPKFKNKCNHDYDHDKYNEEVQTELKKLNATVKQAVHDYDAGELAGELNDLSSTFRTRLRNRGKRQGGTHAAWMGALKGTKPKWYEPFSLAGDVTSKQFPGQVRDLGDELPDVLASLRQALLNL